MTPELLQVFKNSLLDLSSLDPGDDRGFDTIRRRWRTFLLRDACLLDLLYRYYFSSLGSLLGGISTRALATDLSAYKFVLAFSSASYLETPYLAAEAQRLLWARHDEHLVLIGKALARPNHRIVQQCSGARTGNWEDVVRAMLELYGWHGPKDALYNRMASEMLPIASAFCRAFPGDANLTLLEMRGAVVPENAYWEAVR